MGLKAVLENLDSVDEAARGFYAEKDGKFYLDVEDDIKAHPKVTSLKNALDRVREEKTALATKFTELEGRTKDYPEEFSLDEWHRLKALDDDGDEEDKAKRKAKEDQRLAQARTNYEQQIANLKTKYDKDLAERDTIIERERSGRAKDQIELALDKAIDKANIDPKYRAAVRALHQSNVKHALEDDELRIYVESDLGELAVTDFMNNWAQSEDGKPFVHVPTGPSGKQGNGVGGTANNPFAAANWNKTEQANLNRTDAVKADRLAKAAGFPSVSAALAATRALATAK